MTVFTNALVFDGHTVLPGRHDVTVDGKRIASVSPHDPAREGATDDVVDVDGMTVMPGLITCHLHPDFYRYQVGSGERPGMELPPGVMTAIGVRTCQVLLESGFTGYVGASCAHDIDASLRIAISQGIIPGPRIRPCGHHIGTTGDMNNRGLWWKAYESPGVDLIGDGPDEMRKLVRTEINRGVKTIKIFAGAGHGSPNVSDRNMSRDEIEAIVTTAHERGARVRAHVATKAMILECIELGVDVIDHGDEIDAECVDAMVEAGTFWVPSMVYLQCLLDLGYAEAAGVTQAGFDRMRDTLPAAQEAGVRILIGDDYSGVFRDVLDDDPLDHQVGNYGREFAFYSAFDGLSATDVLTWGTSNAGQLLVDDAQKVGVIEPGAIADLIVVDGDPTVDPALLADPRRSLKAVMRDGRFAIDRLAGASDRGVQW